MFAEDINILAALPNLDALLENPFFQAAWVSVWVSWALWNLWRIWKDHRKKKEDQKKNGLG